METLIRDIGNTRISDKAYTVMNQFCMWLGEDHQELQVIMGKSSRPMRKIQPTSCASNDDLCSSIFCSECNDTISYDAKQLHISV
jgi:hypothetical protein